MKTADPGEDLVLICTSSLCLSFCWQRMDKTHLWQWEARLQCPHLICFWNKAFQLALWFKTLLHVSESALQYHISTVLTLSKILCWRCRSLFLRVLETCISQDRDVCVHPGTLHWLQLSRNPKFSHGFLARWELYIKVNNAAPIITGWNVRLGLALCGVGNVLNLP